MRKCIYGFVLSLVLVSINVTPGKAQSEEAQQLLLNVEKLAQLKKILENMYKGYKIVTEGYNAIKNISEGNFSLHKTFLDGLLEVSPTVKKYKRIVDIINRQRQLVREYKDAYQYFKDCGSFSQDEIDYLRRVYSSLFDRSLKSLDNLAMVITANKLRMTDAERLQTIDDISEEVVNQVAFLRSFNNDTKILLVQRQLDIADIHRTRQLSGLIK